MTPILKADILRRTLTMALGLALAANGTWMLVAPAVWYVRVPGVVETGPANLHFIRDIGCAYLVAGISVIWLALAPVRAWPAALAGGTFLGLHAWVHAYDFFTGHESARNLIRDLPPIFLPAVLVLWLAWRGQPEGANRERK
jgi:uncharacterized protein YjeT (DUF2065 family)